MQKIILTGGGTAGHVMPHLALINKLNNTFEIHYLGSKTGIENQIIKTQNKVQYHTITTTKLARKLTTKNLLIPFLFLKGYNESKKLLKTIKPNIIFSKGGFVALPVVFAAHKLKIPVISHESDLTLGLANKLMLRKSKVMCCSFEKTAKTLQNNAIYTGTPFRQELFNGNKTTALSECNFSNPNKPVILFFGGSLGAKAINKTVQDNLKTLCDKYNIVHIVGKNNLIKISNSSYHQLEFTNSIQNYFALADIVVTRAGSNSINELLALKKPMLLIPLPKAESRGDQLDNAKEFYEKKYCEVLQQENLNIKNLMEKLNFMLNNKQNFVSAMSGSQIKNGTNEIINLINKHKI